MSSLNMSPLANEIIRQGVRGRQQTRLGSLRRTNPARRQGRRLRTGALQWPGMETNVL